MVEMPPTPPLALTLTRFIDVMLANFRNKYFKNQDTADFVNQLKSYKCTQYHDALIYEVIKASLSESLQTQNWLSKVITVLSDMFLINTIGAVRAFEKLIQRAQEITTEQYPDVCWQIMAFMRCAETDKVLPPGFSKNLPESFLTRLIETTNDSNVKAEVTDQLNKLREYKKCLTDYLTEEFIASRSMEDLPRVAQPKGLPALRHEAVKRSIEAAMGHGSPTCESLSRTLSDHYGVISGPEFFAPLDIYLGFLRLYGELQDLVVDIPNAPNMLAKFTVRAIADEIIPSSVLNDVIRMELGYSLGVHTASIAKKWMIDAKSLNAVDKFMNIWHSDEFEYPVLANFKTEVERVLRDHCDDRDICATTLALTAMDMTPDQCVDFVRRGLQFGLEHDEASGYAIIDMLISLVNNDVISLSLLSLGREACKSRLEEVEIDVPNCRIRFETMINNLEKKLREREHK